MEIAIGPTNQWHHRLNLFLVKFLRRFEPCRLEFDSKKERLAVLGPQVAEIFLQRVAFLPITARYRLTHTSAVFRRALLKDIWQKETLLAALKDIWRGGWPRLNKDTFPTTESWHFLYSYWNKSQRRDSWVQQSVEPVDPKEETETVSTVHIDTAACQWLSGIRGRYSQFLPVGLLRTSSEIRLWCIRNPVPFALWIQDDLEEDPGGFSLPSRATALHALGDLNGVSHNQFLCWDWISKSPIPTAPHLAMTLASWVTQLVMDRIRSWASTKELQIRESHTTKPQKQVTILEFITAKSAMSVTNVSFCVEWKSDLLITQDLTIMLLGKWFVLKLNVPLNI
eukprot:Protomagalhaensia_wolfi_Nauph_80__4577@NODE_470_length_2465_cov_97_620363_g354_i0_p1_GENE_NODE_470_length_2465_cov_97_620363_g354_i0NODE_470_length_2465_cov_97_620363_g354_i0_p1_ORF_typecomplete_len339_score23_12_NODE_470_length_2465_cov_97_620363_g354_i0961112